MGKGYVNRRRKSFAHACRREVVGPLTVERKCLQKLCTNLNTITQWNFYDSYPLSNKIRTMMYASIEIQTHDSKFSNWEMMIQNDCI